MKRLISIILCLTLLLGLSIEAFATDTEPIVITPEVFTERFNAYMKVALEKFDKTHVPVELILGEVEADGTLQFSLDVQDGYVIGKAKDGIVQEVEVSINSFFALIAGFMAISNIPNSADAIKDAEIANTYVLKDPENDKLSYSNGYQLEFKDDEDMASLPKLFINRLP